MNVVKLNPINSIDEKNIRNHTLEYENLTNTGDFSKWIDLYTDNSSVLSPHNPIIKGKNSIADAHKSYFENMNLKIKIKDILDMKIYGPVAIIVSSFSFHATPKNGDSEITLEPDGKALTVLERQQDNTWKILYDCYNSNV